MPQTVGAFHMRVLRAIAGAGSGQEWVSVDLHPFAAIVALDNQGHVEMLHDWAHRHCMVRITNAGRAALVRGGE